MNYFKRKSMRVLKRGKEDDEQERAEISVVGNANSFDSLDYMACYETIGWLA